MLESVLGNRDIMEKLRGIASDNNEAQKGGGHPEPPCEESKPSGGHHRSPTAKDRRRLIEALEPYLSPERCEAAKKLLLVTELIGYDGFSKER